MKSIRRRGWTHSTLVRLVAFSIGGLFATPSDILFAEDASAQVTNGPYGAALHGNARSRGHLLAASGADDGTRILLGRIVKEGKYPWMLALVDMEPNGPKIYCGASLVAATWAVTAAHCGVREGDVAIKDRVRLSDTAKGTVLHVKTVHQGRRYIDDISNEDDIALIEFRETAPGPYLAIIISSNKNVTTGEGMAVNIAGWGRTVSNDPLSDSDFLLEAMVETVGTGDCRAYYAHSNLTIPSNIFCAASADGTDSCIGDSGGPAFVQAPAPVLVGIVSWGLIADFGHFQAYTRTYLTITPR